MGGGDQIALWQRNFLEEVLDLGVQQVCDSRVTNLRTIKQMAPNMMTIYIKPPAKRAVKGIVQYADISFNTELSTIRLLSEEAGRQNKIHKVIIMIELGELREGVMLDDLMGFYSQVFELPHILFFCIVSCLRVSITSEWAIPCFWLQMYTTTVPSAL